MTASTLLDEPPVVRASPPDTTDARQRFREILENPDIRRHGYAITVEQYHVLVANGLAEINAELLEGLIVEKMPKSPLHAFLVLLLAEWLQKVIEAGFHLRVEQPMTCLRSEPEPDLAVVSGSLQDYAFAHPATAELVIEIAVSSKEIDRRKAAIYAAAGVREYWIVLPETRQIERHTSPSDSQYMTRQIFSASQTVKSEVLPAFEVNLDEMLPR